MDEEERRGEKEKERKLD